MDGTQHPDNMVDPVRLGTFIAALVALAGVIVLIGIGTDLTVRELVPMYMFTPALATLILVSRGHVSRLQLGIRSGRPQWLLLAGLVSLPIFGAIILVALAVPGVFFVPRFDPIVGPGTGLHITVMVFSTLSLFIILGAGAELGWRGYMLWELAPLGFWRASAVIGAAWGIWHAPIVMDGYQYPHFPVFGVFTIVLVSLAISPLYTYLVIRAKSVIAAILLHGVYNAGSVTVSALTRTEGRVLEELVASHVGLAAVGVGAGIALCIAAVGTPTLNRRRLVDQV